jgi:uncharacterized YigZ family protein
MRKEYLTIPGEASAELEEKKSRFIATVKPVISEAEAYDFINGLKSKYWNATHNVYAYYICGDSTLQKFSDDGEPSGTAGLPVLEAVKKLGVQDVAVVVTRYFGGTLLGAAGLVRAYGKSAAMGIEAAGIIKRQLCVEAGIALDYTLLGKVQALIASKGYKVKDTVYAQGVEIYLYVPVDEYEAFGVLLTDATNARAFAYAGEKNYITMGV